MKATKSVKAIDKKAPGAMNKATEVIKNVTEVMKKIQIISLDNFQQFFNLIKFD